VNTDELSDYKSKDISPMHIGQLRQDYYKEVPEFRNLTNKSIGVNGLGVLRMDIDNLGMIFKNGFDKKYQTISRFSVLSRSLNVFFKHYIHSIIEANNEDNLFFKHNRLKKEEPSVMIVYSGGDDLYMTGAWDDVLEYAYRIRDAFSKYTCQNPSVTLSAGYVIVPPAYPVNVFSELSEEQEKIAKQNDNGNGKTKNSIAVWGKAYFWDDLKEYTHRIIGEFGELEYQLRDSSLDIKGFGHTLFYQLISEMDTYIEKYYSAMENEEGKKEEFYYIYPSLAYRLGRHHRGLSKEIKSNSFYQTAYQSVMDRLLDMSGGLQSSVERAEKNLTVYRFLEYMHRKKTKEEING
ncbi:MAG: type III-A CRISPR-associated protein Cas10/Csm1, partial [Candidatus Muiribacteriaceae bacterium]